MSNALKQTVLVGEHVALGARMVEFGGWNMPVQYAGIIAEHRAVREHVGIFDVSHMGEFWVSGRDSLAFLQYVTTADVSQLSVGTSGYGLLCYPEGGVVDDLFIYHVSPNEYLLVVNASNIDKDWQWLTSHTTGFEVALSNHSDDTALLAVQGPDSEDLLAQLIGDSARTLPFHGVQQINHAGHDIIIARTGYTGEDGFEVFCANNYAVSLWQACVALGAVPCGLGARDSLRFEPCLALYGHELSDSINPYEARLGWVVKLNKGNFVGRDALVALKDGYTRRLVAFEVTGKGIARGDYAVTDEAGNPIGVVTTGMPSPTFNKPLGMALIDRAHAKEGTTIQIIIRDKAVNAVVVKFPFYQSRYKK
jgi:aminomethyltransferase